MKLQFKHQPFQAQAAQAVCQVFRGQPSPTALCPVDEGRLDGADPGFRNHPLVSELTAARILENLRAVQRQNGLPPSRALAGPGINLSVEMETGTGKTYTYVKTMYELNARYGWSKFIVVVPSVAIREGVYQSLQATQEHFAQEYGKKLRFFIYSSDCLTQVEHFASDSAMQVMIINMQAFNSSKTQRIIDKRLDAFGSRRPIDRIAKTNPILIIDEPQSVEGRQTRESLRKFNPLFTLRYSATHKDAYNMVYRLDAMDAYNRHLVKKIAALGVTLTGSAASDSYVYVEGVDLSKHKAPTARLGFEFKGASGVRATVRALKTGDDLFSLSHGLAEYADGYRITRIDGRDNSVTFLNGRTLYAGQIQGSQAAIALQRRVQIRETIRTHLRREQELYPRGIKVLSLFFIDEVSKYRLYDGENDDGRNGEYARMFEEEYEHVVGELRGELRDEAYSRYLGRISAHETHQGYFSIDRRKGRKARFVEGKMNRKTQTCDDADAYELIMRDKERLLSLDEPVRFLFSHSALREGWDNPNVFQICTLKPQSESEIRSRQEIGRGLRLCVNQRGERMDESVLGSQVQQVNKLTLITDLSFGQFAQALQSGLADSLAGRPRRVDTGLFLGQVLTCANGDRIKVTRALAQAICEDLIRRGYVAGGALTDKYYQDKDAGALQVAPEISGFGPAVSRILSALYDPRRMRPEDALAGNVTAAADPRKLEQKEFQALWEKIRRKSYYTVSFDSGHLIQHAIDRLNRQLEVSPISLRQEYGEQVEPIPSREPLPPGGEFQRIRADQTPAHSSPYGGVRYDLVGKLVEETGLTRATIASILSGMTPRKFALFRLNPEEFILQAGGLINQEKAAAVIRHITYHKLDAVYDTHILTHAPPRGKLGQNAMAVERSIYDYLIYDSQGERQFARQLEERDEVALYIKLPKAFFIPTPAGKYSPNWAILFREGTVKHLYFVVQTTGGQDPTEPQGTQAAKIACAKAHFAAISDGSVACDAVADVDQLLHLAT